MEKFLKQWRGYNNRNQFQELEFPDMDEVKNPWVASERKLPRIRMARSILDREDILKLEY